MGDEGKNTEAAAAGDENEDIGATGAMGATGATEDSSTSTIGEDGGTEQQIKSLIEKKDPPSQEEDVALAEAAATGAAAGETMENNSDIAGGANHPVDSTDTMLVTLHLLNERMIKEIVKQFEAWNGKKFEPEK